MEIFKRLQSKSSNSKAQYAFFTALSITFVVAFIWSTTLPARLASISEGLVEDGPVDDSSQTFSEIFNEAKNQVGAIADWDEDLENEIETTNLDNLKMEEDQEVGIDSVDNTETHPEDVVVEEADQEPKVLVEEEILEEQEPQQPRTVLIEVKKSSSTEESIDDE